jgi:ABC-2 type transport system permease protein
MHQARAILWAQWRTLRNFNPRGGAVWTAIIGAIWYGGWTVASFVVARIVASPSSKELLPAVLPGMLLAVFVYWQMAPLLLAATGFSLDLRKLQAYPIPEPHLFFIEVMLRTTAALEMLLVICGLALGVLWNPALSKWGLLAVAAWVAFNLLLAAGLRDLLGRLLARRRVREVVFFLVLLCAVLPQLLVSRLRDADSATQATVRAFFGGARTGIETWFWPWSAVANVVQGQAAVRAALVLFVFCAAAWAFSRWQFARVLAFDAQAAGAGSYSIAPASSGAPSGTSRAFGAGRLEAFYRLPSWIFRDPLGALIEKDIRFLLRAPRFRVLFIMGFTFGLIIWFPMAFGRTGGARDFMAGNFLTIASVYALLLLGEACFWNIFGFDRSAAQVYFLAPVPFSRVLLGKNLTALIFIGLEVLAITVVCLLLRLPVGAGNLVEACAVTGVSSLLFLSAGNLVSIYQARGSDPDKSFRNTATGRVQALMLVVYPLASIPTGLAYLARWAFQSEVAFFAVIAFDLAVGAVVYKIALDSAVAAAERIKEQMMAALSEGSGPVSA